MIYKKQNCIPFGLIYFNLFFFLLLYAAINTEAQDTTNSDLRKIALDPVIVSAEKSPTTYSKLMRVVEVITREEIRKIPVQSIDNLLEYMLNIDIRNRGTFGTQADISIRGGSFDQTLILLNGVNLTDPQTGHHNLDLPIDLASIERIEILHGPGARIFGPNAFNGAINIITLSRQNNKASISGMAGQYGLYQISASLAMGGKKIFNHIYAGRTASDGFTTNTDFSNQNIFYKGSLLIGHSEIELQSGFTSKNFGANSYYTPKYPNQFESTRTGFAALKFKPSKINIEPVIYWRRHFDKFELFRDNPPVWYPGHNFHRTDVFGSNASYSKVQGSKGRTTIGVDFRYENIVSNKLGDSLSVPLLVSGGGNIKYTLGKSRYNAAIFSEQNLYLKKFTFSAGLLINLYSMNGFRLTLFPGIDAAYNLSSSTRWFVSANRTLRMPTFTDLYYNDPVSIGNPNLKPEEAIAFETGIKYNKPGIEASVSIFKRLGKNMIDWVKIHQEDKWQARNITKVNIQGIEVYSRIKLQHLIDDQFFINTISLGFAYQDAGKSSEIFISKYLLDIQKYKLDFRLDHRIFKNLSANWCFSYQDRLGGYLNYIDGVADSAETSYQPFLLSNARIGYSYKIWYLYAEASNLFDVEAIDFGNVPQPGRWIRIGFRCELPVHFNQNKK